MRSFTLGAAAAGLMFGVAVAQTETPATTPHSNPASASSGMGMPGVSAPNAGAAALSTGNSNDAINVAGHTSLTPAVGANSFTQTQARQRIIQSGFSNVTGLKKDHSGVWRGTAQKNGANVPVWLDYRGDVGQQ